MPWKTDTSRIHRFGMEPIDEAYPNTGEMFSGESEINCYCHDEYSDSVEMPGDNV